MHIPIIVLKIKNKVHGMITEIIQISSKIFLTIDNSEAAIKIPNKKDYKN